MVRGATAKSATWENKHETLHFTSPIRFFLIVFVKTFQIFNHEKANRTIMNTLNVGRCLFFSSGLCLHSYIGQFTPVLALYDPFGDVPLNFVALHFIALHLNCDV